MAIDNPEQIRFCNEVIRPLAEVLGDLVLSLEAIGPDVDRLLPTVPNDDSVVMDGRESEGIPRLTGQDIHALAATRTALLSLRTDQLDALIARARVRPPRIT